ncbi:FAD linked oxidase, N-terminal [Penicillium italicum]|uniref:FAD linked oxidase, N-terminal n=1 Tax=Penicillium italicum TaxID=40296 RepID=A0A0A2KY65_PENIT|nr:FAD linked oxidase, N-terminal [Penicillium italicum]
MQYILGVGTLLFALVAAYEPQCRSLPGDVQWPRQNLWDRLNATVDGQLIAAVPLASVCHDPQYNETACAVLQKWWSWARYHENSPTSVMTPWFQDQECSPYTSVSTPCQLGNIVAYSINVSSAADVQAGINFTQKNNVRLVIKNTGHDYMGKSTGKGGLGLWMHNLNAIEVLSNYSSPNYQGPALKLGAGVVTSAAYEAANQHGLRIVGGDCPSVGIAGGFTQGGGHSILSSQYGMGADQVVEWEVVTATGVHLIASPSQNADLYWALSGGGPGTYGVVISMTIRAYSDAGVVGGASLAISSTGLAPSVYWGAIRKWHEMLLPMTNAGASVNYLVTSSALTVEAITLVNGTADDIRTLLQPLFVYLSRSNVTQAAYTAKMTTSTDFLSHYLRYFGPLPDGAFATAQLVGGRLVPQSILQDPSSLSDLMALLRNITVSTSFYIAGFAANLSITASRSPVAFNAVLPAWRETGVSLILPSVWNFTLPRSVEVQRELQLTNNLEPQLRKLTPGSGTYLNEANFMLRTWKEDFYGANYDRLRAIKKKYDPEDLFYAHSAVGSDVWTVADNGRMCRS